VFYKTESKFSKILDTGYKNEDIGAKVYVWSIKRFSCLRKKPDTCYKAIRVWEKIQSYFYKSSNSCYKP